MGREVKRVSKFFDWPIKEIWKGYLNPYYKYNKSCPFCDGSGYNEETRQLYDDWYAFGNSDKKWSNAITQDEVQALVDHNRLMDFTHHFVRGEGWKKREQECIPTAEEVNEWAAKSGIGGHDSINCHICVETRAKRNGVYGMCEHCGGEGSVWQKPEYKESYDNWEPFDPPKGDWFQLWETTSEGSPTSPPFETPEELAKWLFDNDASTFGRQTTTYENWLSFIKGPGYALSAVSQGGVLKSGVDALVEKDHE